MKKLLISALVLAVCLGFGATGFAAASTVGLAFTDIGGHEAEFELTALGGLGIYTGAAGLGGAVKPEDPITRAQFCKVVVTAANRSSTAVGLAGRQPTFTDGASVPPWAWGYVNVAVDMGIIRGYADGSFGPNNPVNYGEAVTMLIRMVPGHVAQVGVGLWPNNFLFYGVGNEFTGGVDVGFPTLPASRGDMAKMLFATMQIEKLNALGVGIGGAFLADRIDTGVLTIFNAAGNTCTIGAVGYALASKVYLAGAASATSLLQLSVIAVENAAGGIVAIGKNEAASSVTGVFASFVQPEGTDTNHYIKLADGTKVASDELEVKTLNGDAYGGAYAVGDELVITVGKDGSAAFVVDTRFEDLDCVGVVTKSTATPTDTHIEPWVHNHFDVPTACLVTVNGAAADRDTLAKFDVVAVALNLAGDAVVLRANRVVVEGTVTGTSTSYPGPVLSATLALKAGGSKTFTLNTDDGYVQTLPTKNNIVKYGLDAGGELFVGIPYAPVAPFVIVKSYVEYGDGTATATVEVRGTEVTYKVDDSFEMRHDLGNYVISGDVLWIEVDTGTETIVDLADVDFDHATRGFVAANSGGNLTLDVGGGSYYFVPASANITVFAFDNDTDVFTYKDVATVPVSADYVLVANDDVLSKGYDGHAYNDVESKGAWMWIEDDTP